MADAVRLGLVGCGKAGQKYLQALVHLTEAELVATYDPDYEAARRAAMAFDAPAFEDLSVMLRQMDIDGVVVAAPSHTHRQLVDVIVAQGVSALVEQPLTLTYEDALAMHRAAKRGGVVISSAHPLRLLPSVRQVAAAVRGHRLGTIIQATAQVVCSRTQSFYDEMLWRQDPASSGGLTFSEAISVLDVLVDLLGVPEEVFAVANHRLSTRAIEDAFSASLVFASGALATLSATTAAMKAHMEERIALVGTQGSATIGPTLAGVEAWRIEDDDEQALRRKMAELPPRTSWQSNWDALHDFVEALREGTDPFLTVEQSLNTIACAEAVVRSMNQGRVVAISEIMGTEAG